MAPTGKFAVPLGGGVGATVPGTYTIPDKSAMVAPVGLPVRRMAIVASAKGGAVGSITRVLRGDEQRVLRGGLGAQMATAAFRHGVTEVLFVRADQATPAILDLGAVGLYAVNPGRASTALQGKVSVNTTRPDAVDLFLKDASGAEPDETYRMVGPMLDLVYVGSGSAPTATLARDADGVVTLTLSATSDSGAAMTIDSNAVPSVADLAEAINRSASWTARGVCPPAYPFTSVSATTPVTFTGGKGTLIGGARLVQTILDAASSRIARAALPTGAPTAGTGPGGLRVTSGYEFFTGGTDGAAPSTTDYINALRLLEEQRLTGIALGTDAPAVVAALSSHVNALSGPKARNERYAGWGPSTQPSKAAFLTAALAGTAAYGDVDRLFMAGNIPYDYDVQTGRLTEQHGAVLAAALIAIKVSGRPEESTTFKRVRFPKLKFNFSTEELEELIEGGVAPVHFDAEQGALQCMAGITTWTQDANTASRNLAQVDAIDYLNRKVRQRVTSLSIGKVADEARIKVVLQSIRGLLEEEVRSSRNPEGILTAGLDPVTKAPSPAFRNLVAVFDGGEFLGVDFDANLVGEIKFVRVRPRFTPVRIEARA